MQKSRQKSKSSNVEGKKISIKKKSNKQVKLKVVLLLDSTMIFRSSLFMNFRFLTSAKIFENKFLLYKLITIAHTFFFFSCDVLEQT